MGPDGERTPLRKAPAPIHTDEDLNMNDHYVVTPDGESIYKGSAKELYQTLQFRKVSVDGIDGEVPKLTTDTKRLVLLLQHFQAVSHDQSLNLGDPLRSAMKEDAGCLNELGLKVDSVFQSPPTWLSSDTFGFMSYDHEHKMTVISFKGSTTTRNLLAVAAAWPVKDESLGIAGARVHAGLKHAVDEIKGQVKEATIAAKEKHPDYQIVVTGHSFGGAVARLLAWQLYIDQDTADLDIKIVTLASMAPGNKQFAEAELKRSRDTINIMNQDDVIPYVLQHMTKLLPQGWRYMNGLVAWRLSPDADEKTKLHLRLVTGSKHHKDTTFFSTLRRYPTAHRNYFGHHTAVRSETKLLKLVNEDICRLCKHRPKFLRPLFYSVDRRTDRTDAEILGLFRDSLQRRTDWTEISLTHNNLLSTLQYMEESTQKLLDEWSKEDRQMPRIWNLEDDPAKRQYMRRLPKQKLEVIEMLNEVLRMSTDLGKDLGKPVTEERSQEVVRKVKEFTELSRGFLSMDKRLFELDIHGGWVPTRLDEPHEDT